jgi:hypothetical protein
LICLSNFREWGIYSTSEWLYRLSAIDRQKPNARMLPQRIAGTLMSEFGEIDHFFLIELVQHHR